MDGYRAVYKGAAGEIEEKKSRFIANIVPVSSENEALEFIAAMKKQYWDARHNCSAYIIGRNRGTVRCSDDGEPAQTAGKPMLDVLMREGIYDAAVAVTRYFGGTLLGTGGLVRAYQGAVQAALAGCVLMEKQQGQRLALVTEYNDAGKIQYFLANHKIPVLTSEYVQNVTMELLVPKDRKKEIEEKLLNLTNAAVKLEWGVLIEFAIIADEVKIF